MDPGPVELLPTQEAMTILHAMLANAMTDGDRASIDWLLEAISRLRQETHAQEEEGEGAEEDENFYDYPRFAAPAA